VNPVAEKLEADAYGEWHCVCGNTPSDSGFYPCDRAGVSVQPTEADWPDALYRCDGCRRIVLDSVEGPWVVGRVA